MGESGNRLIKYNIDPRSSTSQWPNAFEVKLITFLASTLEITFFGFQGKDSYKWTRTNIQKRQEC